MEILIAENISKTYIQNQVQYAAIKNISLIVEKGDFISIVGHSGGGKSTLLNVLSGLDEPTLGKVIIANTEITTLPKDKLIEFRRRHLGFIFQNYNLISSLNVYENIALPVNLNGDKVDKEKLDFLIKTLSIEDLLKKYPTQLSGGQQQRVSIVRALISSPEIIFADEPTGNLDNSNSKMVMELLLKLNKDLNQTILLVTHELENVQFSNKTFTISDGEIIGENKNENIRQTIC